MLRVTAGGKSQDYARIKREFEVKLHLRRPEKMGGGGGGRMDREEEEKLCLDVHSASRRLVSIR